MFFYFNFPAAPTGDVIDINTSSNDKSILPELREK